MKMLDLITEELLEPELMDFVHKTAEFLSNDLEPTNKEWFKKRIVQYLISFGSDQLSELSKNRISSLVDTSNQVKDWLASLPESNPRLIPKLFKVTWSQAVEASKKWHEQLERQANDPKRRKNIKGGDDVNIITSFPNGYKWVDLKTPKARDFEGTLMGHCVGRGNYDDKRILSLRDGKNEPHCTIEVTKNGSWEQVKGKGNKEIVERYRPYVIALANEMRPKEIKDAKNFGCVFINGTLYDYNRLPDGLTIDGELNLSVCTGLTNLPNNLTVNGNLNLSGCTGLTNLPNNLTVNGSLYLHDCTGLTSLPDGLIVHKNLWFSKCIRLTSLPYDLTVNGSLYLYDCTGLTSLPDGLTINEHLYLTGCIRLTKLPNRLTVHGNLHLNDCVGLTSLPDGLIVDKIINLDGCINLKRIPKHLVSKCRNIPEHLG